MAVDTETRPPKARSLPEPAAEEEVNLGRYGRRLSRRWWLPVLGILVGAAVGWAFSSTAASDVNRAEATVYLGQPLSVTGSQVPSVATNPAAVREIARSDEVVEGVAGELGIDADRLRNGISTSQIGGAVVRQGQTNQLFDVAVRGPWSRATVAEAANLLAAAVVERTSSYVDTKLAAYEARIATLQEELDGIETRIDELERAVAENGLSAAERLALVNLIALAQERHATVTGERTTNELLLAQARDVEKGQVVTEARASQVTPRSDRSSMLVGALIGLLVGLVAALLWDPLSRRRGRRPA